MKLTRIDYSGGYVWVINKRVRPSTKDFTFWAGLLFYPLSAIYDDSLKVVAQSTNLSIPNVPYVEFEEEKPEYNWAKGCYEQVEPKTYSEDDLRRAIEMARERIKHPDYDYVYEDANEIILSLNQPPLDIEIETTRARFPKGDDGWEDIYSPVTYMRDGKTYLKVKQN